jgi:phage tail sheath protein FI
MSEFTYAGVYIKEIPSGPGPISGVTTSNLGLIGFTSRGPVDYPTLVTSFTEFNTKFGTFLTNGLLPTMAYAFFQNSGQRLYVVRVTHPDSNEAVWDYELASTDEVLGVTVVPSGLYDLSLDHVPVKATVPGTVTITFEGAPDVVFTDDGLGTLTGAGGGGGSGSIDYETGEVTIQLKVPGDYTGGANRILATYTYRVLRFEMKWPGAVGNFFRITITPGSDDYMTAATASWSRFTVTIQEDLNQDPANRAWSTLETFSDLVFDDPISKNYITTVMNDSISGSQYVAVTDYGNAINPPILAGTQYLNENLYTLQQHSDGSSAVVPDPYNGAWKGWAYQLAHDVFPTTFSADFRFIEDNTRIGTGDVGPAAVPLLTWTPAAVVAGSFDITCNLTVAGASVLVDDGAGHLTLGGVNVGTINYTTGALAIDLSTAAPPDTFVAGYPLTLDCTYAQPVTVIDDGNGALSIKPPSAFVPPLVGVPTKFQLNTGGTNSIDYDTGEIILTWKIAGDPAAGPDGTFTLSTPAEVTSTAGPWNLTSGMAFNLIVDAVAPVLCTFTGTRATAVGGAVFPIGAVGAGDSCSVIIGGVTYPVVAVGGETLALEIANLINTAVAGGGATVTGGGTGVDIYCDIEGLDSSVQLVAGPPGTDLLAQIGHVPAITPGAGTVGNIHAVDAADYKTFIEGLTAATVDVNLGGSQTTHGLLAGSAGLLTFTDAGIGGATAALGLGASPVHVHGIDSLTGGELADYYDDPAASILGVLTGGLDGSATDSGDVVSPLLAADMRGLYAFGKVDELMQLVAADFQSDTYVIDALLTYAELMKDKFVICCVPHGLEYQDATTWKRFTLNRYSSFGAIYYPHVKVKDPITAVNVDVPPGGHVAGVYARTDQNKNVGKCPAGMEDGVLAWSVGLEYDLTPTQVGVVYENKINPLVQWPYTGRCVWGGRSMDVSGGEWPYLQMRRLFMFVEKSVFKATHIHVFKNNGAQLWNEITTQLVNFLSGLYQGGYFAGTSADDAFFVICNRSNNPQNTVDQGIVFCDVGIAANKPAEYIVFRFSQKSLS